MKKPTLLRALATLLVAGSLSFVGTAAAQAAPTTTPVSATAATSTTSLPAVLPLADPDAGLGSGGSKSVCSSPTAVGASSSMSLPVQRWSGSSSEMHTLLLGSNKIDNMIQATSREMIVGSLISMSNNIMGLTTGLTGLAINFCPIEQAGGTIDQLAGSLGGIITGSTLGVLIIVVIILVFVIQTFRRGSAPLAQILTKAAIFGVLAMMVAGSMNSTGGDGSGKDYIPGAGSPGWFLKNLNGVVGSVAGAPAAALSGANPFSQDNAFETVGDGSENALSCDWYVDGMKTQYAQQYAGEIGQMAAGVPLILSDMFEETGINTWRTAQFGAKITADGRPDVALDDQAWCRLLDWNAGTTKSQVYTAFNRSVTNVPDDKSVVWDSKAFFPATDEDYDRSLIAWSACYLSTNTSDWGNVGSWGVHPAFADQGSSAGQTVTPADCVAWMNDPDSDLNAFKWPTTVKEVRDEATSESVATYINTIHGNENQAMAMIAAYTYPVAAISVLASFGLISIGVIVAKAMMMLLMISIIVLLAAMLLPGKRSEKVMGTLSMAVGMTLFVFMAQLVFSIVALLTKVISGLGGTLLGEAAGLTVLWAGLSPLMAVLLLHWICKSILGMPSPFTMRGAMDWGTKMAKGGGGAMFSGVNGMLGKQDSKIGGAGRAAVSKSSSAIAAASKARFTGAAGAVVNRKGAAPAAGAAGAAVAAAKAKGGATTGAPGVGAGSTSTSSTNAATAGAPASTERTGTSPATSKREAARADGTTGTGMQPGATGTQIAGDSSTATLGSTGGSTEATQRPGMFAATEAPDNETLTARERAAAEAGATAAVENVEADANRAPVSRRRKAATGSGDPITNGDGFVGGQQLPDGTTSERAGTAAPTDEDEREEQEPLPGESVDPAAAGVTDEPATAADEEKTTATVEAPAGAEAEREVPTAAPDAQPVSTGAPVVAPVPVVPAADPKDIEALRSTRRDTRAERREIRDQEKAFTGQAKDWANTVDPSVLKDAQRNTANGAVRNAASRVRSGVVNDMKERKDRITTKANYTKSVFRDQGILAGSGHVYRGAKKAAPKALLVAGVITAAPLVGALAPVALVAAPAAFGAAKTWGAYSRQGVRNREATANVVSLYAKHVQGQKKDSETLPEAGKKATPGVSPKISDGRPPFSVVAASPVPNEAAIANSRQPRLDVTGPTAADQTEQTPRSNVPPVTLAAPAPRVKNTF